MPTKAKGQSQARPNPKAKLLLAVKTKAAPALAPAEASQRAPQPRRSRSQKLVSVQRTAQNIVVDQAQSLELVRSAITATISGVAYVRQLFPEEVYEGRMYDFSNPEPSYDKFMAGDKGFTSGGALHDKDTLIWRVLQRGRHEGVDKVLQWLERGVLDALQRNFLSAIQFSIYDSQVLPEHLVEAYIITITYDDGIPSLQVEKHTKTGTSVGQKSMMLATAKQGVQRLINLVAADAQRLDGVVPELPEHRILSLNITYTDGCPKEYNPPGFYDCFDPKIIVDHDALAASSANTGFHTVKAKLFNRHLQLPHLLDDNQILSSQHEVPGHVSQQRGSKPSSQPSQASQPLQSESVQAKDIVLHAFKKTGISRDPRADTQDTLPIRPADTQRLTAKQSTQDSLPDLQQYTQPVRDRIQKARELRESTGYVNADSVDPGDLDFDQELAAQISCECGVPTSDDILLQCNICFDYKHIACCGYLKATLPQEFVCYTCLLVKEKTLFSEMRHLCVQRRALNFMCENEHLTEMDDLAGHLNLSSEHNAVLDIVNQLEKEGALTKAKSSRKGKEKAGTPLFTLDKKKIRDDYFQPHKMISHYFGIGEDEELDGDEFSVTEGRIVPGLPNPADIQTPKLNYKKRRGDRASSGNEGSEKRTKFCAIASPWQYTRKSTA